MARNAHDRYDMSLTLYFFHENIGVITSFTMISRFIHKIWTNLRFKRYIWPWKYERIHLVYDDTMSDTSYMDEFVISDKGCIAWLSWQHNGYITLYLGAISEAHHVERCHQCAKFLGFIVVKSSQYVYCYNKNMIIFRHN